MRQLPVPPAPAGVAGRRSLLLFSSVAVTVAYAAPSHGSQALAASTPYSQSQLLQLGLDANGKIRACPATNPGCVSSNPRVGASSSVASPLLIPEATSGDAAVQSLRRAILRTQSNVRFGADEDTPYGHYLQAEVDGGLGRDVMEFLVKKDAGVVVYRCVATKVTFVYPFTTAVGDSRGQRQRIAAVSQDLGWYAPDIAQASMDADHAFEF